MIFGISHKTIKSSIKSKNYLFINPRFWTFKIALEKFPIFNALPTVGHLPDPYHKSVHTISDSSFLKKNKHIHKMAAVCINSMFYSCLLKFGITHMASRMVLLLQCSGPLGLALVGV